MQPRMLQQAVKPQPRPTHPATPFHDNSLHIIILEPKGHKASRRPRALEEALPSLRATKSTTLGLSAGKVSLMEFVGG